MNAVEAVKTESQREQLEHILLEHDNGQLYLDVWKLGVNVALRISDLLELTMAQVKAIDPIRLTLTTTEAKTGKARELTLNSGAMEVIERRLNDYPDHVWLFQSPLYKQGKNKPAAVTRRAVAKAFHNAGQRITPMVNMSTHSMRKTRGYAMHKAGISIEQISSVLNHSNTRVTLRYIGLTAESAAATYRETVL